MWVIFRLLSLTRYKYFPHFCLVVYAQGTWNKKIEKAMIDDIATKFEELGDHHPFNEEGWDQITLFNPRNTKHKEEWGKWGIITPCEICLALYEVFTKVKGSNQGEVLFSHYLLNSQAMISFLEHLLQNRHVKKTDMTAIPHIDTTGKISEKTITNITRNIRSQNAQLSEILQIIEKDAFKTQTIYTIMKDRYY